MGLPGGTPGNSRWGFAARFSKSWPYFRPKNVIFHTRFQTRPVGRNYFIITWIRAQTKKFFKSISNSHVSPFLVLIWNWKDKEFMNSRSSLENHTQFQSKLKCAKCIPVFRPKWHKNRTWWGGTYLYSLLKTLQSRRLLQGLIRQREIELSYDISTG